MRRSMLTQVAILLLLLSPVAVVRGDPPEKPAPGMGVYLMVLWPPGAPIPGDPKATSRMFPSRT